MRELASLPPAVAAFDAAAAIFDERYGAWRSVAAQRRAVRRLLLSAFPAGAHLLELAGGTGEDALHLAAHGRRVTLTDGAPAMVERARARVASAGLRDMIDVRELQLEDIGTLAGERLRFDGAYSNFAGLNCVSALRDVARGLAAVLPPGAPALLVLFGPLPPGEVVVQLASGDVRAALRRLRGSAPARIGAQHFEVHYHRPRAIRAAFLPWFHLERRRGIGVFVPPSAAEPGISRWPRMLGVLELLDRAAAAPFSALGDHVLFHFTRTEVAA